MILGLAGAKHAGKNTVAKFIAEEFGDEYNVKEWSFAEDLKKSAMAALGLPSYVGVADQFKEEFEIIINSPDTVEKISGREYLQYYGTEAHREVFGDNFWVDNLIDKINPLHYGRRRVDLITDVRFENEAEVIKRDYGGYVIQIQRPQVDSGDDTHASEKPLHPDLVGTIIYNEGTLEELRDDTVDIVRLILKGTP